MTESLFSCVKCGKKTPGNVTNNNVRVPICDYCWPSERAARGWGNCSKCGRRKCNCPPTSRAAEAAADTFP